MQRIRIEGKAIKMLTPEPLFISTIFIISVADLHLDEVFMASNP